MIVRNAGRRRRRQWCLLVLVLAHVLQRRHAVDCGCSGRGGRSGSRTCRVTAARTRVALGAVAHRTFPGPRHPHNSLSRGTLLHTSDQQSTPWLVWRKPDQGSDGASRTAGIDSLRDSQTEQYERAEARASQQPIRTSSAPPRSQPLGHLVTSHGSCPRLTFEDPAFHPPPG